MTTTPTPPEGPHADLRDALTQLLMDHDPEPGEWPQDQCKCGATIGSSDGVVVTTDPYGHLLDRLTDYVAAALSDSVPREGREPDREYERELTTALATAERERDALAAQLAEVDAAVGDPEHPRFSQPEVRARMHAIVAVATANGSERDRILARVEAEVKAQALDEQSAALEAEMFGKQVVARIRERAAAIRAEVSNG